MSSTGKGARMLQRLRLLLHRGRRTNAAGVPVTDGQGIANAPSMFFCGYGGHPYYWTLSPTFCVDGETLPDIDVCVGGSVIGWIQNVVVDHRRHRATVGHIAVARALVRKGHGREIAHVLGAELHRRFGVIEIVFSENSSKYESAGYESFFISLGAVKLPAKPGWRPDWQWQFGTDARGNN